jgi:Fe-Mn family superoxide dismutase
MSFVLPQLPYSRDSLAPYMSSETLDYHYGKHHQTYINNTNNFIKNTNYEHLSLEEIVKTSSGSLFNNSAQVWNHSFFWKCLTPQGNEFADSPLK